MNLESGQFYINVCTVSLLDVNSLAIVSKNRVGHEGNSLLRPHAKFRVLRPWNYARHRAVSATSLCQFRVPLHRWQHRQMPESAFASARRASEAAFTGLSTRFVC